MMPSALAVSMTSSSTRTSGSSRSRATDRLSMPEEQAEHETTHAIAYAAANHTKWFWGGVYGVAACTGKNFAPAHNLHARSGKVDRGRIRQPSKPPRALGRTGAGKGSAGARGRSRLRRQPTPRAVHSPSVLPIGTIAI